MIANRFAVLPRLWHRPGGAARVSLSSRAVAGAVRLWLALHWQRIWPLVLVALAGLAHGVNMLNFPYYDNDEGTYVAQAWAILERGTLAQYTYWYDHAPAGWIQIAAWAAFFNGFYTFGTSVDSGRVLMLVYQCIATYLVYRIAHVISHSLTTATICTLLFAFSAYGIYFHRRVLLDNLTTPWMLLSILLVVRSPLALTRVWGSAVALAISILSKELTIFLVPVLAGAVFLRADRAQRWFALFGWLIIVGAIFGTYPLMALLKNELFPSGTLLGGSEPHVSLIESLRYQMSRGKDAGLWGFESGFWGEMRVWSEEEPLLVIGGTAAALLSAGAVWWYPRHGALGLLTLSLYAFLSRGGTVIGFYLVPLLPLLALNLGLLLGPLIQQLQATVVPGGPLEARLTRAVGGIAAGLCLTVLVQAYYSTNLGFAVSPFTLWTNTQVVGQNDAVAWVRRNVRNDAAIIMDCYPWLDLQSPPPGQRTFPKAHWYWKLDADREVGVDVFRGDPRTADYLIVTPQLVKDADSDPSLALVRGGLAASTTIHRIDTGGYPVEIRRVRKLQQWPATSNPMLTRSWTDFKTRFISNGRVTDLGSARVTTAEGQASALLRAVYQDDRAAFDAVWAWTRTRLQVRGDGLLVARWGARPDGTEGTVDAAASAEADQDAALALLFAARRWQSSEYQRQAVTILAGIWERETAVVGGGRVVVAGDWARGEGGDPIVSTSALAPYAYRIFAEADPDRPWSSLVNASYALLDVIQSRSDLGGPAGVVPNWVALDRQTGQPRPATALGALGATSSIEASRLPSRLALDLIWFAEPRARAALQQIGLPARALGQTGRLAAAYRLDGSPAAEHESLSAYAGALPTLLFRGDDELAQQVYADKVLRAYIDSPWGTHWGDRESAADQYRGWLATALMDGSLSNLWAGQSMLDWASVQPQVAAMPTSTPQRPTAPLPAVARR